LRDPILDIVSALRKMSTKPDQAQGVREWAKRIRAKLPSRKPTAQGSHRKGSDRIIVNVTDLLRHASVASGLAARWVSPRSYSVGFVVLVLVSVVRLYPTYTTFSQTYDEPLHVACGMEWLLGVTDCDVEHPPLAEVAVALGPYLKGIRPSLRDDAQSEGNEILYARGEYFQNLALARAGTVPFFVLACVMIYLWAWRWFDAATGFWAVLLFVNVPPVLGHAGLATLDIACASTILAALYQWVRWLETPTWSRAIMLTVVVSAALLTKLSSIAFLPMGFAIVLALGLVRDRDMAARLSRGPRIRQASTAVALTGVLLWAGYRFTVEPIRPDAGLDGSIERSAGPDGLLRTVEETPLPLTSMIRGIYWIYVENQDPIPSYLFGKINERGSWAFFPVVAAIKTPLGFSLLTLAGFAVIVRGRRKLPWTRAAPVAIAIALALACVAATINMGVRHALSLYPFASILAGYAVARAFQSRRWPLALAAALAVSWAVADSWRAHPDYLAYFNRLAGAHPEQIVAESDLDWGQDLHRLGKRLKTLGVQNVSIAYFGTARLEDAGLPPYVILDGHDTAAGYIAVSVHYTSIQYALDGSFGWARSLTPIERIGKSIDLYYVPGPRHARQASGGPSEGLRAARKVRSSSEGACGGRPG
jgi:hypothetical protein